MSQGWLESTALWVQEAETHSACTAGALTPRRRSRASEGVSLRLSQVKVRAAGSGSPRSERSESPVLTCSPGCRPALGEVCTQRAPRALPGRDLSSEAGVALWRGPRHGGEAGPSSSAGTTGVYGSGQGLCLPLGVFPERAEVVGHLPAAGGIGEGARSLGHTVPNRAGSRRAASQPAGSGCEGGHPPGSGKCSGAVRLTSAQAPGWNPVPWLRLPTRRPAVWCFL